MRLFFALGFSPATRQAIAQVQQRLRRLGPEPCPELFALREELIFQLERRGLWYQPGEFRPHVTLARKVSFPGEAPGVEALLPQPLAAPCGRVSLVRSQLTAAGALYNEVAGKNPPV